MRPPPCIAAALSSLLLAVASELAVAGPRNTILMIGDGMGAAHVEAARLHAGGALAFELAPYRAEVVTDSVNTIQNGTPTDSAAAATAMSTGQRVSNSVVSVAVPGDQSELETLVERFHAEGKSGGLVTSAELTDGAVTPYAAHALASFFLGTVVPSLLEERPEVMLGGGGNGLDPLEVAANGYTVVRDRAGLEALDPQSALPVAGLFGTHAEGLPFEWDWAQGLDAGYDTLPLLREMTTAALALLESDPDGFFLLVHSNNIDRAGHLAGDGPDRIGRDVFAVLELEAAALVVLGWAAGRDDTLILVTADHETGGLDVLADNGAGTLPTGSWATSAHTAVPVPIYAWGPNAPLVTGTIDNTEIRHLATPEPSATAAAGAGVLALLGRALGRGRRSRLGEYFGARPLGELSSQV